MTSPSTRRTVLLLAVMGVLLLIPSPVRAQSSAERLQAFCSALDGRRASVSEAFTDRLAAYDEAVQKQRTERQTGRDQADTKLNDQRAEADLNRSKAYELLKQNQESEEAKAAVDTLAREVELAVQARRAAYDKARSEFRQEVDKLASARSQGVGVAAQEFQTNALALLQSAAQQCAGKEAGLVRIYQDAITGLRDARLAYNEALRSRQDFKAMTSEATAAKSRAYEAATAAFQQTIQLIRSKYTDLKL